MDDVILMGSGTLQDWLAFEVLLDLFCSASGMKINTDKSCLLYHNFDDSSLNAFRSVLPYKMLPI